MDDFLSQLNRVLLSTYRDINRIEERMTRDKSNSELSINELHLIETIAKDKTPKSITYIAQEHAISLPSVTVAINKLVKKGYVERIQSTTDKREYRLRPTQKYIDYYNISYSYLHLVMERAKQRFTPDDLAKLEEMLQVVSDELMPEIELPK